MFGAAQPFLLLLRPPASSLKPQLEAWRSCRQAQKPDEVDTGSTSGTTQSVGSGIRTIAMGSAWWRDMQLRMAQRSAAEQRVSSVVEGRNKSQGVPRTLSGCLWKTYVSNDGSFSSARSKGRALLRVVFASFPFDLPTIGSRPLGRSAGHRGLGLPAVNVSLRRFGPSIQGLPDYHLPHHY